MVFVEMISERKEVLHNKLYIKDFKNIIVFYDKDLLENLTSEKT